MTEFSVSAYHRKQTCVPSLPTKRFYWLFIFFYFFNQNKDFSLSSETLTIISMNDYTPANFLELRKKAEEKLANLSAPENLNLLEGDVMKKYHELQVYQIELEMLLDELKIQNEEKENRSAELILANIELVFQNEEKVKRAAELVVANKELAFQNQEKALRETELQKMEEIKHFNTFFIGRELKMIELKEEINKLLQKAGLEKKYFT